MPNNKKTTEQFIKDAVYVHGNRYDYSKTNYMGYATKLTIVCKVHGEFIQRPANHISGNGCSKCAKEKIHHKLYRPSL